ncbi:MAG: hypothetical protein CYG59_13555, partial [Chloroflexi bacterium]
MLAVTDAAYRTCKERGTPGYVSCQKFLGSDTHQLAKGETIFLNAFEQCTQHDFLKGGEENILT